MDGDQIDRMQAEKAHVTLVYPPLHARDRTALSGPLSIVAVQTDEHFLIVACDVERNGLLAKLVRRAEDWQWSSLWRRTQGGSKLTAWLSDWPVERPRHWLTFVNHAQSASELEALRLSVKRGRPFGDDAWVKRMATRFGMEYTLRPRGRPKCS